MLADPFDWIWFLAHRSCELSGQILSVGGGHVSAVQLTVTRGVTDSTLTAETVRDRLDQIFDTDGAFVPRHLGDEMKHIIAALDGAAQSTCEVAP